MKTERPSPPPFLKTFHKIPFFFKGWLPLGKPSFKKNRNFMKNFHKMVTPSPCCICEILIQIFTVNELVYNRIYEI